MEQELFSCYLSRTLVRTGNLSYHCVLHFVTLLAMRSINTKYDIRLNTPEMIYCNLQPFLKEEYLYFAMFLFYSAILKFLHFAIAAII